MKVSRCAFAEDTFRTMGFVLFTIRHDKNLSLKEVAKEVKISVKELEKWELGHFEANEEIDLEKIFRLASFYNVQIRLDIYDNHVRKHTFF